MKAFVIMPYGGSDPERVREFKRVFRYLIQDSIDNYDNKAEIIRQDYSSEGGYIIRNVIDNLANAELVVADLSYNNWNVAYELGLRHVMSKYGTVLICNDQTELPYDIKQMNVIIYPAHDWIDSAEEISDQITRAIENAMKQIRPDSPVFDVFPGLPDSLPAILSGDSDKEKARMLALSDELDKAKAEIRKLRTRIEEAGLDSSEVKQTRNLRDIMQKAVSKRTYIGSEATSRLQELADNKSYDEFAEFLTTVLQDGYLDEYDCKKVYAICKKLDIPAITKAFLETVVEFYPDSEELKAWLANAYSTDYHDRDKAISMVNETLGIRRRDGRYELTPKVRTRRLLGAMFDVYLHLKKYEDIILIGKLLLEKGHSKHGGIIQRNICYAALYLEEYETARVASEQAVALEPESALSHYARYKYLDAVDSHEAAYMSLEQCVRLEPDDADYYFMLASEICSELYARDCDSQEIRRIDASEREKYAVPFVLRAFLNNYKGLLQRTVEYCKRNNFNSTVDRITNLLRGELSMEDFLEYYDFRAVEYCFRSL